MSKIAYNYLVKLLSFRDYSEHKLREKLREKKFSPEESETAINDLKSKGYLKEDLYTEARIKGFMHKHYSASYIKQKLKVEKLEVEISTIWDIFEEYHISEEDQIQNLLRKKLKNKKETLEKEDYYKLSQSAIRYVISKGHEPSKVFKQIKNYNFNIKLD